MQQEVYPKKGASEDNNHAGKLKSELSALMSNPAEGVLSHETALEPERSGSEIWDKSVIPLDFGMTDFSDLEERDPELYIK